MSAFKKLIDDVQDFAERVEGIRIALAIRQSVYLSDRIIEMRKRYQPGDMALDRLEEAMTLIATVMDKKFEEDRQSQEGFRLSSISRAVREGLTPGNL